VVVKSFSEADYKVLGHDTCNMQT